MVWLYDEEMPHEMTLLFKNSLIIHEEKTKEIN